MSFEGYEIQYCLNGHEITSYDVHYPTPEKRCPICSCEDFVIDLVDQTNGCQCDDLEDGEKCSARQTKLNVVKRTEVQCSTCEGIGFTQASNSFCVKSCICKGNPECERCYGTNTVYTKYRGSTVNVLCSECEGRGTVFVPVYDLTPLLHIDDDDEEC